MTRKFIGLTFLLFLISCGRIDVVVTHRVELEALEQAIISACERELGPVSSEEVNKCVQDKLGSVFDMLASGAI